MADDELRGVSGWLALAFIQIIAGAISAGYAIYVKLTQTSSSQIPVGVYAGLLMLYLITVIFGLMENKKAKWLFMISYATSIILAGYNLMQGVSGMSLTMITGALWMGYFGVSKRVKATFVN